jgi:hypothetical protein
MASPGTGKPIDEPESGASILSPLGEWDHCSGVNGEGDRENLVWKIPMVFIQLGSPGSGGWIQSVRSRVPGVVL